MDARAANEQRALRELVARFADRFSEDALLELASRLLATEATRNRWEWMMGEIVACAVYNGLSLTAAEAIVLRTTQDVSVN